MALIVVVGLLFGVLHLVGVPGGGPITPLIAAQSLGVSEAAVVDVGDAFAAAVPVIGGVSVELVSKRGGEVRTLTTSPGHTGQPSAHLLSYGGADLAFNSYFYGTADGKTSRVSVNLPGTRGGSVVAGTWLVAIPTPDLTPSDVSWSFMGPGGTTILSGNGIFPPDA